jgi:hypothetical protein
LIEGIYNMKRSIITVTAFSFLVTACAGRDAAPVASYASYDGQLSCSQLGAELTANEAKVVQLQQEHDSAHTANIAIGVVGALLFWPALFAIDASDAQQVEIRALRDRNSNLARMQASKKCHEPQTVEVPAATLVPLPVSAVPVN